MRRDDGTRVLLVLAIAAVVTLLAGACSSGKTATVSSTTTTAANTGPKEFTGFVRTPPLNVSEVTLPDTNGDPVNMVAEPGGLRLVYFGYTFCPDVCPATMGYVKMALESLPAADRKRVQVDMITVDPTRDTADKLAEYVKKFVPEATAIRTDDPYLLRNAAKAFSADYSIRIDTKGKKEVSHTGDLYVVDDTGTVILAWPFGTSAADIEFDLKRLLAGDRPSPE